MTRQPRVKSTGDEELDLLQQARQELYAVESGMRAGLNVQTQAFEKLLDVVRQLHNAELDVDRVLTLAAARIIEVFEAERVFILDSTSARNLRFRLAVSFKGQPIARPETEVSHAVVQEVIALRAPVLVADAVADPRFAQISSVRHLDLHSVIAAPLLAHGELLGVVYADNRMLSGAFTGQTLQLLNLFASHVAIALRNAQLFRHLAAARAELAAAERLRAIGEVAAYIAHEIKNPLVSIQILTEGLKTRGNDEEYRRRVLNVVPGEISRLNRAVAQILDYARPTPLIKVPLDPAMLLRSALHALAPQIEQDHVILSENVERDLSKIDCDGERMREVFLNIFKNALEAMSAVADKRLHITLRRAEDSCVELLIEDTGPGIPTNFMGSLFEPFHTTKASGTGLGLAFCRKIVREHGGRISAENRSTGGARFKIVIPIAGS